MLGRKPLSTKRAWVLFIELKEKVSALPRGNSGMV
jgi:hypothetical protein